LRPLRPAAIPQRSTPARRRVISAEAALDVHAFVFYLLAGIVCGSGLAVILARNPVHSVLWLILAFFNAAGLFLLLGAEFLAMILVIVYVGAVAVLFLFVVMMLDIDFASLRSGTARYLPFGLLLVAVITGEFLASVSAWKFADSTTVLRAGPILGTAPTNTQALGALIYTHYAFVFMGAGMVLLTALIGAVVLTHRQRMGVRRQDMGAQTGVSSRTAVDMVKVTSGAGVVL
jgi:NADH-quinone oxidoreductase subunit J